MCTLYSGQGALVLTADGQPSRRNPRNQNTNIGQEVDHMINTEGQGHQVEVEGQEVGTGEKF